MNKRILEILDNVRYWDTCPDDYKKDIEDFLKNKLDSCDQVYEKTNDYEFNLKQHWKEGNNDSKPIGGFSDW